MNFPFILAQDDMGALAGASAVSLLCTLIFVVLIIAALWRVFTKAGKPGWAAIIPIYNFIVLLDIAGKPVWWIVLLLIPLVNVIVLLLIYIDLAKAFGYGIGFAIGLWFLAPIFLLILGFGGAQYQGRPS